MNNYLIKENKVYNGIQKVYRFQNNFGASVIQHDLSYGHEDNLWELGVVSFVGDLMNLNYETPITDNVIGNLEWEEVEELLEKIKQLESK